MTAKLNKLVEETAKAIVDATADCLFDSSRTKITAKHLTAFAEKIVAEVEQTAPTPPTA
jgi:hypothetical protein